MKGTCQQGNGKALPQGAAGPGRSARRSILKIACFLFSETGFHGTHVREVCKRAGMNLAGIWYHFQNKEGLYAAVSSEVGRRLAGNKEEIPNGSPDLSPQDKLERIIASLFEKLADEGAWVAKLVARELVDAAPGVMASAWRGLERDFLLLQAAMREVLGGRGDRELVRLHALSVINDCLFYCLASQNLHRVLPDLPRPLPAPASLAQHVTQRCLAALKYSPNRAGELQFVRRTTPAFVGAH